MPELIAYPLGVFADGSVLMTSRGALDTTEPGFRWYRQFLLRVGAHGEVEDSLGIGVAFQRYWDGEEAHPAWLTPQAHYEVTDSSFFVAIGEAFEVCEYDITGRLRRIIRRHHDPAPVTAEDRQMARNWWLDLLRVDPSSNSERAVRIRQEMETWRFPPAKPHTSNILHDSENDLWVEHWRWFDDRTHPTTDRPTTWSVFDPGGRWLGDVVVPAAFVLHDVQGTRIIGSSIDESNLRAIHIYRLDRT